MHALQYAVLTRHVLLTRHYLYELGMPVDARDRRGRTALLLLCRVPGESDARLECARLLLEAGADVNASDDEGASPLEWASNNGNHHIADLILAHKKQELPQY